MTSAHVFIATSLDGFIARQDGKLDWLLPCSDLGEDHGYEAFIADIDGMIMGRGTYEAARSFGQWPYDLPTLVLSRTLTTADIGHPACRQGGDCLSFAESCHADRGR